MDKRIILHIGMHKTASSYMQANIFPKLNDTLFIYGASKFIKQWNEQVHNSNNHLLISHECLSGIPWDKNGLLGIDGSHDWLKSFEKNINTLRLLFPDAVIIVFFRKHGDLLTSLHKQYIHEGGILNLSDFYGQDKLLQPKDLSFKYRIDLLNKLFENVYFLDFEDFKNIGDQYLKMFFQNEFSLDLESGKKSKSIENRGVSGNKLEALRKVNRYYNKFPEKLKKILRGLGLSPRFIFQSRLRFWKAEDSKTRLKSRKEINKYFNDDWKYFESVKYVYQAE
jgi:hypothetical protein